MVLVIGGGGGRGERRRLGAAHGRATAGGCAGISAVCVEREHSLRRRRCDDCLSSLRCVPGWMIIMMKVESNTMAHGRTTESERLERG